MKLMFASDIHGSLSAARAMAERYRAERCDRLILLGDLLYHGPRNDLPDAYDPKGVIALLNGMKDELLCVRGNCDAEVDQMVLSFPILADYALLWLSGRCVFLTHGHLHSPDSLPPLKSGDLFISGHTHIPGCWERSGITCLNPGSVALPKQGHPATYMVWEDGVFSIRRMDGSEYLRYPVQ